jgi:hypothetical protein
MISRSQKIVNPIDAIEKPLISKEVEYRCDQEQEENDLELFHLGGLKVL